MSTIKCPHCGRDLPSESAFCPYCMEQIKRPVAVSAPSSGKGNRKGLYVMILITAVILLAVIILLVLRFCGNPGDRSTDDTTANSTSAVGETDDVNNPDFDIIQEEIQGAVQGETTTVGDGAQASENDTTAPTEGEPVNNNTQGVAGNGGNDVPTTENNSPEQSGNIITTSPQVTVCNHNWVAQTKTVYHEEEGHYEDVRKYRPVTKYKCELCHEKYSSLNLYYSHFDREHLPTYEGDPIKTFRERYTTSTEYEYYTESQWVVDKEAYDEEVVTGYKCSKCGKIR